MIKGIKAMMSLERVAAKQTGEANQAGGKIQTRHMVKYDLPDLFLLLSLSVDREGDNR
jgi:hypothetical protein